MHRIEIDVDRGTRKADTVERASGVFKELGREELSEAEFARLGTINRQAYEAARANRDEDDQPTPMPEPTPEPPTSRWSPQDILNRLTQLYAKFDKPWGRNG